MKSLIGRSVYLRLAETSDAEFINSLRTDSQFNRYLSAVDGSVAVQREWLKAYKKREHAGAEYYFIVLKRSDNTAVGSIRIYDFRLDRNSFAIGSWILNGAKTRSAALESALLCYRYGFKELGFTNCHLDVRKGNEKVISFHQKSGAALVGEDGENVYFDMSLESCDLFLNTFRRLIEPEFYE